MNQNRIPLVLHLITVYPFKSLHLNRCWWISTSLRPQTHSWCSWIVL